MTSQDHETRLAVLETQTQNFSRILLEVRDEQRQGRPLLARLVLVERVMWGLVGLILVAVMGALMTLLIAPLSGAGG